MSVQLQKTKLVPPDGGWGWVVLISALTVNLLIPGTVKSFGVLFVEFLEVFKASTTAASWMPALCYFLYSALGPLSSILSNKFSYKTVTMIGGACAAIGMMSSYFANSVSYLYVSYGLMVGMGAGLTFPPTVYIVTAYFVKYRGLANGLCVSGSAIGSIILPPFMQYLLNEFGYRGAVLIIGALTLNTILCGLLYHPVEEHMKKVPITGGIFNTGLTLEECPKINPEGPVICITSTINETSEKSKATNETSDNQNNLDTNHHTLNKANPNTITKSIIINKPINSIINETSPKTDKESTVFHNGESDVDLYKKNLCQATQKTSKVLEEKVASKKKHFDFSVLRDPIYLIILISNSTSAISNTNFMILLPSYAKDEGFDKSHAAALISVVSLLDLIGRIGGASLSDITCIPKYCYFIGGLGVSGVALALLPMATSYGMLAFFCALFGLSSGIYIGITTVILSDMLGSEKLSSSYGISLFVNGMLQLIGPPVCGVIYERINSYKPIFFAFGIILIWGTALWALMPIIRRNKNKKLQNA